MTDPGANKPEMDADFAVAARTRIDARNRERERRAAKRSRRESSRLRSRVMINGVHAVLFTQDAEALRAFLRDVLDLPSVDAGGGWPIFGLPPAELAAHPSEQPGATELYLMCDDLEATIAELEANGVELSGTVRDEGWGVVTAIKLPGGGELGLYEPHHPRPPQSA